MHTLLKNISNKILRSCQRYFCGFTVTCCFKKTYQSRD